MYTERISLYAVQHQLRMLYPIEERVTAEMMVERDPENLGEWPYLAEHYSNADLRRMLAAWKEAARLYAADTPASGSLKALRTYLRSDAAKG